MPKAAAPLYVSRYGAVLPENGACPPPLDCYDLFTCGRGYTCPTGATRFCIGDPLDPDSSIQARAACNACFGANACLTDSGDCGGPGWTETNFTTDSPIFSYGPSTCTTYPEQPPGRVYAWGNSFPANDYGYWGYTTCP